MIQTSSLVVAEEEQLVLDDRPANRASEHVPTQLRCCNHPIRSPYSQTVLPLIRVEDVVAEVLEGVAMERIRARLDRRVDDAALVVSEFRGRILSNQIEFLNRIRRWSQAQAVFGNLVVVQSIEQEVIGLLAVPVDIRTPATLGRVR